MIGVIVGVVLVSFTGGAATTASGCRSVSLGGSVFSLTAIAGSGRC